MPANPSDEQVLTARWVFPVAGPPLESGTVTVRGETIASMDPFGARTADVDLGNVAIIPGLVNAHTHLDLSGARGRIPPTAPDEFTKWLSAVIDYRRSHIPSRVAVDICDGLTECIRFGTTLIGDIAFEGKSWDLLSHAPICATVFREVIGLSPERWHSAWHASMEWWQATQNTSTCRKGCSPHAPYSVHRNAFGGGSAKDTFATHIAESPAEEELLKSQSGPFVPFLEQLGVTDRTGMVNSFDYILIRSRVIGHYLFVHANYLPLEACRYISGLHSIVYCPRTHAAFGHPPHPFREFLKRGVRVCFGTDSLASNPDLDLLAEARFIRERYPDFPGDQLLRMATLSGAEALGWEKETGSLESGKSADLVALPLHNREYDDPHELLFRENDPPDITRRTMWRGTWRES